MERISVVVKQAGQMIGLPRTTIYKLIREKRIDSFKHGRRRLITVASLERFVAEQVAQSEDVKLNSDTGIDA